MKKTVLVLGVLLVFALAAAGWSAQSSVAASRPTMAATWGQYVVTQAGISQGVIVITMYPVGNSTRGTTYVVSDANATGSQVLTVALTAISAGKTVAANVDTATQPYPTIYSFLVQSSPVAE